MTPNASFFWREKRHCLQRVFGRFSHGNELDGNTPLLPACRIPATLVGNQQMA